MIDASQFHPTERRFVASFPAALAGSLRADRNASDRRARELVRDWLTLRRECIAGGGLGMVGPYPTRWLGAATRFDAKKISSCVLDVDPSDAGTTTTAAASVVGGSDFSNAAWTKTNTTIAADATTAPDSTNTADQLTTVNTSSPRINQNLTNAGFATTGQAYITYEIYLKYVNIQWIAMCAGTTANLTFFDIQNGVVGAAGAAITGATITPAGSGWYKCTWTSISGNAAQFRMESSSTDATITYVASASYYAWGASVSQIRCTSILNRVSGVAFAQATANVQPGLSEVWRNGRLALRQFNGLGMVSTESALITSFANSTVQTVFAAWQAGLVTGAGVYLGGSAATSVQPYRLFMRNTNRDSFQARPDSGIDVFINGTAGITVANTPYVKEQVYDGTQITALSNGTASLALTAAATGITTLTRVSIGGWGALTTSGFQGLLGRISSYNRVLSAAERSYLRVGFGNQWAIAVTP